MYDFSRDSFFHRHQLVVHSTNINEGKPPGSLLNGESSHLHSGPECMVTFHRSPALGWLDQGNYYLFHIAICVLLHSNGVQARLEGSSKVFSALYRLNSPYLPRGAVVLNSVCNSQLFMYFFFNF